jgi:uncharacterized protein YgiM (DUF1202 family)
MRVGQRDKTARRGGLALLAVLWSIATFAADEPADRVKVADPYIELRTGPGRGFPVFHVVDRGEWVEILSRRTDWFRVRSTANTEGWVSRAQLENTLTESGAKKTFRDVMLDDFLRRRVEFGFAWGRFESEPVLKAWGSYRVDDTIAVELAAGQIHGIYSGTSAIYATVVSQPWSDRSLSPFFSVGVGQFRNVPRATLIGANETKAKMAVASLGLRYYVTERFVARTDYTVYVPFISDERTDEYKAITAGVSFFF